jgi:RimJ/RimL family protein N-acetyltransferase
MCGRDRQEAVRVVGAPEQWLGTVRRLAPAEAVLLYFKGFTPEWGPGAVALGYCLGGRVHGVAQLLPLKRDAQSRAEMRIVVDEAWQGCGVGTLLMEGLLRQAGQLGVTDLYLRCHALNEPMQRLAERFGAEIRFEDCQAYGHIVVQTGTFVSEPR